MSKKTTVEPNLEYLKMEPKFIKWKVIVGGKLDPLQMYDVVFDYYDLKIRKLVK